MTNCGPFNSLDLELIFEFDMLCRDFSVFW